MKDKIQAFYDKVEKYGGWQQVPAIRIYLIFEEVIEPGALGFTTAKAGLLARPIDGDITHVIKLRALKGASYDICFGVSLSYVPYPYVPKVKWHRALKSANLDLFEEPQVDWWRTSDHKAADVNPYLAQVSLGEKCFREELSRAWKGTCTQAMNWFDAARSLQGILQKGAAHLSRRQDGVRHLPGARLVNAFTLGKLGRPDEASSELLKFFEEYQENAEVRANLQSALQVISLPYS
jgi:hypothetical protein